VDYISNKAWARLNYFGLNKDRFHNRVDVALGDCIRGDFNYIAEDDDGQTLLVTAKGREFIKWMGFLEEYLKRHKRSSGLLVKLLLSQVFLTILGFIIQYFLSK
jgi:hypothetical protein